MNIYTLKNTLIKFKKAFESKTEKEAEEIKKIIEFEEKLFARISYSLIKSIFSPLVKKIWIEGVEGLENMPRDGPVIIAANHESYFDFISLIAVSPRKIHYLAAEKFFSHPLWKPLMHLTSQIKVDRKNPDKTVVHKLVYSALKKGKAIGIFPEGTRNRINDGKLQKAFVGVGRYAITTETPILPVGIIGTYDILAPHEKFPRFKRIIRIKIGELMSFQEYYNIEYDQNHFREVTNKVMLKIAELCGKKYPYLELEKQKSDDRPRNI